MMKPSPRGLLQTVDNFLKLANIMRVIRMIATMRLFHIDFLSEMRMQKGIFDI